ncbi:MAG: sterol desaturase family protein [Albidovulum sp.]|nr:sterol desaturase family protein [Albidovulum sp.]
MTSKNDFPEQRVPAGQASEWNWNPDLPIPTSPLFRWPPKPIETVKWLSSYWLGISAVVVEFVLAFAVWEFLQPGIEEMKSFSFGWVFQIYVRNLALLTLVAGGLHAYLYSFRKQGSRLKYDARDLAKASRRFTFRNQVFDNMFWSLASGVTVWTAYEVAYNWAAANDYVPSLAIGQNPVWFVAWFALIPIWSSLHFYWVHRVLHWPPLYRFAHSLHHRNVTVGPWSGISMHPLEHAMYFSSVLIHVVVASHPVHVLFHLYLEALNPAFSHSGFDGLLYRDKKRMELGDFFHQLHHRYFECNYGTAEMPWDKWFGSFHDGTASSMKEIRKRGALKKRN